VLFLIAAEYGTQPPCVRCKRAAKNNECTGAGSLSEMASPDNLSLSVIGTISISKTGFNNTLGSTEKMYQFNKQRFESMEAALIGCFVGADCAQAVYRGIGDDR
jgi:hypothetical protein